MKKLLVIALAAGVAGSIFAAYESPLWEATTSPWGTVDDTANWGSGVVPFGSTTGLISSVTLSAWGNDWYKDINLRIEGTGIMTVAANAGAPSTMPAAGTDFALRGGTAAGLTTLIEVAGDTGALNLNVPQLTMWSQDGGNMTLSVLSGEVEAGTLNLVSGGKGTINIGDGNLHSTGFVGSDAAFNMLAGGTGTVVVDDMNNLALQSLNFETGNLGSFTYGENAGSNAGGQWEWAITHGWVSIDSVVDTDLASYSITTAGGNDSTISVIPEPATFGMMALIGGGMVWIRKRFMI